MEVKKWFGELNKDNKNKETHKEIKLVHDTIKQVYPNSIIRNERLDIDGNVYAYVQFEKGDKKGIHMLFSEYGLEPSQEGRLSTLYRTNILSTLSTVDAKMEYLYDAMEYLSQDYAEAKSDAEKQAKIDRDKKLDQLADSEYDILKLDKAEATEKRKAIVRGYDLQVRCIEDDFNESISDVAQDLAESFASSFGNIKADTKLKLKEDAIISLIGPENINSNEEDVNEI